MKTFLFHSFIFHDRDDCELFLEYVNCQHSSIKFTLEVESNNSLPFLDVMITRDSEGLVSTSVYRK